MKQLYISRHGQTVQNVEKIMQGHMDGELTKEGVKYSRKLGKKFASKGIDYIFSGDTGRHRETTNEILKSVGRENLIRLEFTPLLRERGFGNFEGEHYSKLNVESEKELVDILYDSNGNEAIKEEVEPLEKVLGDVKQLKKQILDLPNDKNILTVGSGWKNSYFFNELMDEGLKYRKQSNNAFHYVMMNEEGKVVRAQLNKKFFFNFR